MHDRIKGRDGCATRQRPAAAASAPTHQHEGVDRLAAASGGTEYRLFSTLPKEGRASVLVRYMLKGHLRGGGRKQASERASERRLNVVAGGCQAGLEAGGSA